MVKKIKHDTPVAPYEIEAIGVLNPYGQIWSRNVFDDEEKAKAYVRMFWRDRPEMELRGYSYIPVRVLITPIV